MSYFHEVYSLRIECYESKVWNLRIGESCMLIRVYAKAFGEENHTHHKRGKYWSMKHGEWCAPLWPLAMGNALKIKILSALLDLLHISEWVQV